VATRINIGSGEVPLPGFVNVDALPDPPRRGRGELDRLLMFGMDVSTSLRARLMAPAPHLDRA
jgi:hypothetical protein